MKSFACRLTALLVLGLAPACAAAEGLPFFSSSQKFDAARWYVSDGWTNGDHQSCEWRAEQASAHRGNLRLQLSDKGGRLRPIGCAEIQSTKPAGFGRYESRLRTAAGAGLNTAFFTYAGPPAVPGQHDEIDFEFLGKDPRTVDLTFWKNGKSSPPVRISLGFDASKAFHTYAFEWTPAAIRWYVDQKLVHETPRGALMPDIPSRIYLSLWSGSGVEDDWLGHFVYAGPVAAEAAWVTYTPADGKRP